MEQPRRITDSFPRRRRRALGRSKAKRCPQARRRAPPPAEAPPTPAPDQALLEMLRGFDLAWEYGPCTGESPAPDPPKPLPGSPLTLPPPAGITRLQRWERAQALGLNPPKHVRDVLLEHGDNPDVTYRWVQLPQCPPPCWHPSVPPHQGWGALGAH